MHFDKMLPELQQNGHRILIFSQYVIMLNVMEEYLRIRNYKYMRLDGSTAVNIRYVHLNFCRSLTSIHEALLPQSACINYYNSCFKIFPGRI